MTKTTTKVDRQQNQIENDTRNENGGNTITKAEAVATTTNIVNPVIIARKGVIAAVKIDMFLGVEVEVYRDHHRPLRVQGDGATKMGNERTVMPTRKAEIVIITRTTVTISQPFRVWKMHKD